MDLKEERMYSYYINYIDYIDSISLSAFLYALVLLVGSYYAFKILCTIYIFLFAVYEYKPDYHHLKKRQQNKLYGRVRRKNGVTVENELPPMVPNGWYYVMSSYELKKEQVKHITMCGLELAVFRDVNGDVHALDAFCPHLGANMGVGGKVKGTCLECPFHGWKFQGEDGKCTDIPGAKRIPDIARTKSWPVLERNLVILLWYDAEEREPLYIPRECEEVHQRGWVVHGKGEHIVNCHISEIPENGADIAHFQPVHRGNIAYGSDLESINKSKALLMDHVWSDATWRASKDEWYTAHGTLQHDLTFWGWKTPFAEVKTVFEQIGPAVVYLQPHIIFEPMLLLMCVVPIETFKQRVVHVTLGPRTLFGKLQAISALRAEGCMVERDMVLWNNKIFNKQSVLAGTQSDELLVKFRRWYSQFYSENSRTKVTKDDKANLSW